MKPKTEKYTVEIAQGDINVHIARFGIQSAMITATPVVRNPLVTTVIRPVTFSTNLSKDLLHLID